MLLDALRRPAVAAVLSVSALLAFACAAIQHRHDRWVLVWHDEFDGPANSVPNPAKWSHDTGDGAPNVGWGNHELQHYTTSADNAHLDGRGRLVIRALQQGAGYTSARLKTQGRFSFTYGRVEARIRIPYAQGIWPAFWMLGDAFPSTPWPESGEIDIMENFGAANRDYGTTHATVHGPGYSGTGITGTYRLPDGKRFSDDFHVFSVEWDENAIRFFVDGRPYHTVTPKHLPAGARWVFDRPFFLILNVAVGGSPAPVGYPDSTTRFPQTMLIDYVRVYQRRKHS